LAEETPLDQFRSVLAGTARVVSDDPEVDVAWTADAPSQSGAHFRLPMPGRSLPAAQVAEARGFADAMALRLRHHDPVLHQRGAPNEAVARACYDAVEQVRYEALGSDGYAGMRDNLDAALATRMASDPIARAAKPDDVPLQAAVALLLRERLTGQPIPASAQLGTSMVRSWIEQRVGGDFDALAAALEDQKAFQHLALDMLQHLELTQAANPDQPETEEDEGEDQENDREDEQDNSESDAESQPVEAAGETTEGDEETDTEQEIESPEDAADADMADEGEEGMLPTRPNRPWTDLPDDFDYKAFTTVL
jgi:cobaltochelatase CobT